MAQLAIKGHATRGNGVIKILKLLGGKNPNHNVGKYINRLYFINDNGYIESTNNLLKYLHSTVLTLEEVEALMPYKIGDKILHEDEIYEITDMKWHKRLEKIVYDAKGENSTLYNFTPVMKQEKDKAKAPTLNGEDYSGKRFGYKIPDGYEFDTVYNGKIILKPIKPQYPKTYEECYDEDNTELHFIYVDKSERDLYESFIQLIRCRNAYWKIVGEEMGLGKPWEPDWNDNKQRKFGIYTIENPLHVSKNLILVFPTAEMRDAFYENFKDLIEECKELL